MQPAPENKQPKELIPADNYMATCTEMIFVGTIEEEFQGEKKLMPKIRLTWEIPSLTKVFKEEKGPQPLVISKKFTYSMGDKATLKKFLDNWRGKAMTPEESKKFVPTVLLGKPCMLNVIHRTSEASGNVYQDVGSASKLPSGIPAPPQINPSREFDVREFNKEMFDTFPEWLQTEIKSSAEYKAQFSDVAPSPSPSPATAPPQTETPASKASETTLPVPTDQDVLDMVKEVESLKGEGAALIVSLQEKWALSESQLTQLQSADMPF